MIFDSDTYGADADGNRGKLVKWAELEESDNDAVIEKLYETFIDGTVDGIIEIELDGFDFKVEIEDYLEALIDKAKSSDDFKNDLDFQQMVLDEEMDLLCAKAERLDKKVSK